MILARPRTIYGIHAFTDVIVTDTTENFLLECIENV